MKRSDEKGKIGSAKSAGKKRLTQRERLVRALSEEIAAGVYSPDVPMPSENQLCQRFSVSRVTVRLALDVLQNRGLIHRQHGRGTFAHSLEDHQFRSPAMLMIDGLNVHCHACWQMLKGMENEAGRQHGMVTLLNQKPSSWPAEAFGQVGGLIARASSLGRQDIAVLQQQHLPLFKFGTDHAYGAILNFGIDQAAKKMISAARARGTTKLLFATLEEDALAHLKLEQLQAAALKVSPAIQISEALILMSMPEAENMLETAFERAKPDGLILTNEWLSPSAFELLRRRGLSPSKDVFYGMFTHQDYRAQVRSDLAVARLRCSEIGQHIVQYLQEYSYRPEALPDIDLTPTYYGLLADVA